MTRIRTLVAMAAVAVLAGCKHPLVIVGQGDIVDLNNSGYGCSLEQFQAGDTACTENAVAGAYRVEYQAQPRPGWRFARWEGSCAKYGEADRCSFDVPAGWVDLWDAEFAHLNVPPATAVFERLEDTRNSAPIAEAGDNQVVYQGSQVTLDGSGSRDQEGDTLSYRWRGSSPPGTSDGFFDADTAFPYLTVNHVGTYVFELTVSDGQRDSEPDALYVEVIPASRVDGQAYVYSQRAYGITYLGCWTCSEFHAESVHNNLSVYGSNLTVNSIRNVASPFGNPFSPDSACNATASNPPQLWDPTQTRFYGTLSISSRAVNGVCNNSTGYYHASSCSSLRFYCPN
jgi:hypothetical protein